MLHQTFSLFDLPLLSLLILIETILSVDNALALSLISQSLPSKLRNKALFIGLFSAFILRGIGLLIAVIFIHIFYIQLLGGLYLIYLSISHINPKHKKRSCRQSGFWQSVIIIELTDLIFAIDSILVGLALIGISHERFPPKLWIVYLGGIIGLILMRFAAKIATHLMRYFPYLKLSAHLIVGLTGLKLIIEASFSLIDREISWLNPLFLGLTFLLLIIGFALKSQEKR